VGKGTGVRRSLRRVVGKGALSEKYRQVPYKQVRWGKKKGALPRVGKLVDNSARVIQPEVDVSQMVKKGQSGRYEDTKAISPSTILMERE